MTLRSISFLLAALGSTVAASGLQAKALYVSPTGNDATTWANNSSTSPWKTITKAGQSALAGDTVNIAAGTYIQPLKVLNSGTASARIVFQPWSGNKDVIIKKYTVDIAGKSYITIKNLIVQDVYISNPNGAGDTIGIAVSAPSTGVTITGNTIKNTTGSAIAAWGAGPGSGPGGRTATYDYKGVRNLLVEANIIQDAVVNGWNEAITIAYGVDNFFVRNNFLTRSASINNSNGGEAIDIKEGASNGFIYGNLITQYNGNMIYLDAGGHDGDYAPSNPPKLTNIKIYNNYLYKNDFKRFHGIMLVSEGHGTIDGVNIYNNRLRNNGGSGILIYLHPAMQADAVIKNVNITNNSLFDNGQALNDPDPNWSGGIEVSPYDNSTASIGQHLQNISIRNNATYKSAGAVRRGIYIGGLELNLGAGYVVYSNNTDTNPSDNADSAVNPFVNGASGDFTLVAGTFAVDHGAPLGTLGVPTLDAAGVWRPLGNGVDIGAYESY